MRHASNDAGGAAIGAKVVRVLVTNAADSEREKAPGDGVESFVSDAAQQLSAWACVRTLLEPAPDSVDPCIGQSPLPEQQAMRASGVACQPAHSAHPAAPSVMSDDERRRASEQQFHNPRMHRLPHGCQCNEGRSERGAPQSRHGHALASRSANGDAQGPTEGLAF